MDLFVKLFFKYSILNSLCIKNLHQSHAKQSTTHKNPKSQVSTQ